MAKIFVQGKGWIDEEVARQMAQSQAATLADLMPAAPAAVPSGSMAQRAPMERASLRANENALMEGQRQATIADLVEADPLIARRNEQLAPILQGTETTGEWSRGAEGRPKLTMQGAPRTAAPVGLNYEQALNKQWMSDQDQLYRQNQNRELMGILTDPASDPVKRNAAFKMMKELERQPALGAPKGSSLEERAAEADISYKNAQTLKLTQGKEETTYEKELAKIRAQETAAKTPGTMEYKRDQELNDKRAKVSKMADSTKRYADDTAASMERAIADILGTTPDKLPEMLGQNTGAAQGAVSNAVGNLDARWPNVLKFQDTRNTSSAIESLKSKAQMFGLSELRKSGVAPGSITEKEWPKFESLLANIDPTLGEEAFVKQLADIYQQVKSGRNAGALDYSQMIDGNAPDEAPDEPVTMQDVFDTAKSTGKSIDQVIQDARAAGLTIRGM